MSLGRLGALVLAVVLALGAPPAHAAASSPSLLTLDSAPRYADVATAIVVRLADQGSGSPIAEAQVLVERRVDGDWSEVSVVVTDEDGRATVGQTLARDADDNVFRATYDGDDLHEAASSGAYRAPLRRRETVVSVGGPDRVVDEQQVAVRVRWRTRSGLAVPGRVQLWRRNGGDDWRRFRRVRTGSDGLAVVEVTPREDTRWRATAPRLDWATRDRSGVHRIDNLPPGSPVRLPAGAPRPRVDLPRQDRATGDGANASVSRIPDRVWQQMTGRSWHAGCPVGRSGLRLLRINYWGYDGYRYRGELVARTDAVDNMRGALTALYARQLPIRSMYRVDRFGWSRTAPGRRRLPFDGRGQHLGVQLSRRRRAARRPLPALVGTLPRPQHLGEPLPLVPGLGAQRVVAEPLARPGGLAVAGARCRAGDAGARVPLDLRHRRLAPLRRARRQRPGARAAGVRHGRLPLTHRVHETPLMLVLPPPQCSAG